ncbi:GPI biosynthesis protein family Pig-F-domain-containing protein [Dissophora ornata]|nr:GPI biosynthesis protein family Pig-F-domain-containing protein [Dissophora ornata]
MLRCAMVFLPLLEIIRIYSITHRSITKGTSIHNLEVLLRDRPHPSTSTTSTNTMQRTARQGIARDSTAPGNASNNIIAPSYPLLRMTLVAMINLATAYSTLTWIPSQLSKDPNTTHSIGTLPSLSWTLVALFVSQTFIGLAQSYLHSPSTPTTKKGFAKGDKQSSSSSLFNVLNTSISIGAVGTLICHVFAVLFGAGLVHQAKETGQLACYLSLLTFYPASFVLGTDLQSWLRIFIHNSPQTYTEAAVYCQGMMAIFGAWLGSIVIPLDWDRPWQAWPVPCVLGAFLFYCIGTVVGFVVSVAKRQRAARREFVIDGAARKGGKKVKDA